MKGTIMDAGRDGVTVVLENGDEFNFPVAQLAEGLAMTLKGGSLAGVPVELIREVNGRMLVELLPKGLTRVAWPDLFGGDYYRQSTYHTRPGDTLEGDLARAGLADRKVAYHENHGNVLSWGVFEESYEGVYAMLAGMLPWGDFQPNMWLDPVLNIAYVFVPERTVVRNGIADGLWDTAAAILGFQRIVFVAAYLEDIYALGLTANALSLSKGKALVDHTWHTRSGSTKWEAVASSSYTNLPESGWPDSAKAVLREIKQLPRWAQSQLPSLAAQFLLELYYKGDIQRSFSPNALGDLPVMPMNGDLKTALEQACIDATVQSVHVQSYGLTVFSRTVNGQLQQFVCGYAVVGPESVGVQVEIVDVHEDYLSLRPDGSMVYVVELNMHPFGLSRQKVRVEYPHDPRYALLAAGLYLAGPNSSDADIAQVWAGYIEKQAVK